jgi:hypothetical protein
MVSVRKLYGIKQENLEGLLSPTFYRSGPRHTSREEISFVFGWIQWLESYQNLFRIP